MNRMESELSKRMASISIACNSCECAGSNYKERVVVKLKCPYICVCKKEIKTECQYWKHLRLLPFSYEKKPLRCYKCCVCNKYYVRKYPFLVHMGIHTGVKMEGDTIKYPCQFCNAEFKFFKDLASHVFVNGIGNPFECSICHQCFLTKCALILHENFDHSRNGDFYIKDSALITCCACTMPFTEQVDLMEHIVAQHAGFVTYECQYCEEEFSGFDTLSWHVTANGVGNPYECRTCQEVFESKCALVKHANSSHTESVGSSCNEILKTIAQNDERSTTANSCVSIHPNCTNPPHALGNKTGKRNGSESDSTYSPPDFQKHHELHDLQENPIYYPPIRPPSNSQLHPGQPIKGELREESELSTETESSSIPCGSCECLFSIYNEFAIHHFQLSYTCVCQKEIQTECEYWQHFRVKDSTQFKCCICNNDFPQKVDIMQHILEQHDSGLKYACQHCKEEFSSFSALAFHVCVNGVRSHNECLNCHEVFESKCALVKHENTSHTGTVCSTSKKSIKPNTHINKEEQSTKNGEKTENRTSHDFANTTATRNSCRFDSSYSAPDLHHPEPHHLPEYSIDFSPNSPNDSLQIHSAHALQWDPKSIQPILSLEVIHDMNCNMPYNSLKDVHPNGPPNPIQPYQQNGSHPFLHSGYHFQQEGSISQQRRGHRVGTEIYSPPNDPGNFSLPSFPCFAGLFDA